MWVPLWNTGDWSILTMAYLVEIKFCQQPMRVEEPHAIPSRSSSQCQKRYNFPDGDLDSSFTNRFDVSD